MLYFFSLTYILDLIDKVWHVNTISIYLQWFMIANNNSVKSTNIKAQISLYRKINGTTLNNIEPR